MKPAQLAAFAIGVTNPFQVWSQAKEEIVKAAWGQPRPSDAAIEEIIGTKDDPKLGACLEILVLNRIRGTQPAVARRAA